MLEKIAYQCDENGIYLGAIQCPESPREPGVWFCPQWATYTEPPSEIPEGQQAVYDFSQNVWNVVDIPQPEPEPEIPAFSSYTIEEKKAAIRWGAFQKYGEAMGTIQDLQLKDWAGHTIAPEVRQAWYQYTLDLKAVPTQSDVYFINLRTSEEYAWPTQPSIPE